MELQKKLQILISNHARERWMVRVVDPVRYAHLEFCKHSCNQCKSLIYDLRNAIRMCWSGINREITRRVASVIENNQTVNDPLFLRSIADRFPAELAERSKYYYDERAIYVLREEEPPTLVTVLSLSMLDGTILRGCNSQADYQRVFAAWKRNTRMN